MATTDILGLFESPEQYRAQQMAAEREQAASLASLTPMQLANYGAAMGGQQLARGFGGLLGVQDPQLQRIRQRQEIIQTINPADPKSLMAGVQRASEVGDQQLALSLADYMRKAQGDIALAQQRTATKSGQGIQEAARINEIETLLADLDPDSTEFKALTAEKQRLERTARAASGDKFAQLTDLFDQRQKQVAEFGEDSQQVKITDRLINSIAPEKGGGKGFESIAKAEQIGTLMDELETLKAENKQDTPTYRRKEAMLKSLIKTDKPNLEIVGIAKDGKYAGNAVFLDENARKTFVFGQDGTGAQIEVPYTGGYTKLKGGTEISVGGAEVKVDTGEASKAAGKKIGAELVEVKDKQSALDSIDDALGLLNQGIYAGGYGPAQNFIAKYTGIGDKNKVARTEQFLAFIGDVVVPRLKEFGGNDSEQELAYLNRIMGGQIEMEPAALKNILRQAKIKINRGIERLRKQAESGDQKKPLVSTLPSPQDSTQPQSQSQPQPKPTMRFNPTTKKLERIQ